MKKIGSNAVVSACSQRMSAIKKHLGAKDLIYVDGAEVKASDVAQVFQDALDTRAAAVTAKGEYVSALVARDATEAKRQATDAALQPYVLQRFGATSTEAHDFGYTQRKATEKTAVSKAKAVALGKATRDARGTMSKKAKQAIKGTLSPETAAALETLSGTMSASAASAAASAASVVSAVSAAKPAATPAATPVVASTPVAPVAPNGAPLNGSAQS